MSEFDCSVVGASYRCKSRGTGKGAWICVEGCDIEISVEKKQKSRLSRLSSARTRTLNCHRTRSLSWRLSLLKVGMMRTVSRSRVRLWWRVVAPVKDMETKNNGGCFCLFVRWENSGCEVEDGNPYLTRSGMERYYVKRREDKRTGFARQSSQAIKVPWLADWGQQR